MMSLRNFHAILKQCWVFMNRRLISQFKSLLSRYFAASLSVVTVFLCYTGCAMQDVPSTRKQPIGFVAEVRQPTVKTLVPDSYVGGIDDHVANMTIQSAESAPIKQSQKIKQKRIAQINASKTDMTPMQEHQQTTAAIVSAQKSMKMDNTFASAKRIVPFSYSAGGLGPLGKQAVKEMASLAKDADRVYVRGRTDSSGTRAKNAVLAKNRADAVRTMFVAGGVPRNKVHATYCTTCFIASNDTEKGRRLNRRVDVELIMPVAKVVTLPKEQYEIAQLNTLPALELQTDMKIASKSAYIRHMKAG